MDKRKKTMIINTIALILCIFMVGLFCINPKEELKEEESLDKYKVIFDTTGGNHIDALEIEEGQVANEPSIPTREGYEFVGWMLGDELYDFSKEVSGDITLRAEWRELDPTKVYFTIEFDSAGGSNVMRQILEEGAVPTEPVSPTRDGYEFSGWYFNGALFDFSLPINQNVVLVAQWVATEEPEQPEGEKTYTVRFNLNGGSPNISNQSVKAGEKVRNPGTPTRDGYVFNGWRVNSANGSLYNFDSAVNSNITLYASWIARTYTVRFLNENGGMLPNGTFEVSAGSKITSPPTAPTKNFYTFIGFYTAPDGGTSLDNTVINQSMDFYARYAQANVTVTCESGTNGQGIGSNTCTVKISGGTIPSTACVMHNSGKCIRNGQEMGTNIFYSNVNATPKVYAYDGSDEYVQATLVR